MVYRSRVCDPLFGRRQTAQNTQSGEWKGPWWNDIPYIPLVCDPSSSSWGRNSDPWASKIIVLGYIAVDERVTRICTRVNRQFAWFVAEQSSTLAAFQFPYWATRKKILVNCSRVSNLISNMSRVQMKKNSHWFFIFLSNSWMNEISWMPKCN